MVLVYLFIINLLPQLYLDFGFQQEFSYSGSGNIPENIFPENDPTEEVIITDIAIASFYNVIKVQESLDGPYLGQKLPGLTPKLFAKGLISTREIENNIGFAANGKMIFVERIINGQSVIKLYQMKDKGWSDTLVVNKSRVEIFDQLKNRNLDKYLLDNNIISKQCKLHNNTFFAPDKSYIIFSGKNPSDSYYKLKISFFNSNGVLSKAQNLSGILKTSKSGNEYICSISPDGKYLFYIVDGDIYWVEAKIIDVIKTSDI